MSSTPERPLIQAFLIEAAMMLHRYGTPSHRLERVMVKTALSLGVRGQFLYTPTALVISLNAPDEDEFTVVRRVESGPVDVGKLIELDRLLGRVEQGEVSVESAMAEMQSVDGAARLYPVPVYLIACALACASVAIFFHGTLWEVIAAGVVGVLVTGIELLHEHWQLDKGLLEPVAGVLAAFSSLMIAAYWMPIDDRLVTLAGLILLIPGVSLTVALTELAVGHLSAGVARLAGALVSLATLFVGAALVWRIAGPQRMIPAAPEPLAEYWQGIALAVAPVAFAIVFRASVRQWPIIAVVSILGVLVSRFVEPRYGIEVASFLGALSVGCGSNLYARFRCIPALVSFTPGMLILVPGSIGYRSLFALLEEQTVEGVQFGFAMFLIGVSLVGGLIVSNVLVPPKGIL